MLPPQLETQIARQDGLVRRGQALQAGLTPSALRHRLRPSGRWQVVLPGVYATFSGELLLRHRLRAALLWAGTNTMLGASTAAVAHRLRAAPRCPHVHLLVAANTRPANTDYVVVERTSRLPSPVWIDGLSTAPLARTVIDTCRQLNDLSEVRAILAEAVQSRDVPIARLAEELRAGRSRGTRLVREVLGEVGAGVRSVAEAEFRRLVLTSRVLPVPLFNCSLYREGGRWLADPDAYWDSVGLVAEVDSREWHFFAAGWEQTMLRHERLEAMGLHVVHVTPGRIRRDPQGLLASLESAYQSARAERSPAGITVVNGPRDQRQAS